MAMLSMIKRIMQFFNNAVLAIIEAIRAPSKEKLLEELGLESL